MKRTLVLLSTVAALSMPYTALADAGHADDSAADHEPIDIGLATAKLDSHRGRELFVEKGCIACHSVNGVGGEDALALDAHDMDPDMSPFELAARMWRMAPFMIAAQEEELGEQIQFTGEELGDIVAFLHDDAEQHELTEESLPEEVREMMHGHGDMSAEAAHKGDVGHD